MGKQRRKSGRVGKGFLEEVRPKVKLKGKVRLTCENRREEHVVWAVGEGTIPLLVPAVDAAVPTQTPSPGYIPAPTSGSAGF